MNAPLNLWSLLSAIKTHKKFFIMSLLVLATISIFGVKSFYSPQYEARAIIKVTPNVLVSSAADRRPDDQATIVKEEVLNRMILERVVDELGLAEPSDKPNAMQNLLHLVGLSAEKKKPNLDAIIRKLRNSVDVIEAGPTNFTHRRSSSDIFLVSMRGDDPDEISKIINTIVTAYLDEKMKIDVESAEQAYEFLVLRVDEVGKNLQVANQKLDLFKTRNAEILSMSSMIGTTTQATRLDYIRAQSELADAISREKEARTALVGEPEFLVPETTLADIEEGEAFALNPREMLVQLRNQLSVYESKYTSEHPDIIRVRNEIAKLERTVDEDNGASHRDGLVRTIGRVNPEYQRLRAEVMRAVSDRKAAQDQVVNLRKELENLQNVMNAAPSLEEKHEYLIRIRDNLEEQYAELKNRLSEAKIAYEAASTTIGQDLRVIEPAVTPETPVGLSSLIFQLAGLMFAGFVSMMMTYGRYVTSTEEMMDDSSTVLNVVYYSSAVVWGTLLFGVLVFEFISQSLVIS